MSMSDEKPAPAGTDDKSKTHGRTVSDLFTEWWKSLLFIIAPSILAFVIVIDHGLCYINYNQGWEFRLGLSPEAKARAAAEQAQKDEIALRRPHEELFGKVKGTWVGDYKFDSTSNSVVSKALENEGLSCKYSGALYRLDLRDYEVNDNRGAAYLTMTSVKLDPLTDNNDLFKCRHIVTVADHIIYPEILMQGTFTLDKPKYTLTADLVQSNCSGNCLRAKLPFELDGSNNLVYEGLDLFLCCGPANTTFLLHKQEERQEKQSH